MIKYFGKEWVFFISKVKAKRNKKYMFNNLKLKFYTVSIRGEFGMEYVAG